MAGGIPHNIMEIDSVGEQLREKCTGRVSFVAKSHTNGVQL
jgi:hypothetical protein